MRIDTEHSLRLSRTIKATPERIFRAWTEAEEMKRWMCPEGGEVIEAESDLRVGGAFKLVMETEQGRFTAVGSYREIEEPNRLAYTWDWVEPEMQMGETVVTVEIRGREGASQVTLTHEGFPAADAAKGHDEGWVSCLNRLEAMF